MTEETAIDNGFVMTHNLTGLQIQANGSLVIAFDSGQNTGGHTDALYYDMKPCNRRRHALGGCHRRRHSHSGRY